MASFFGLSRTRGPEEAERLFAVLAEERVEAFLFGFETVLRLPRTACGLLFDLGPERVEDRVPPEARFAGLRDTARAEADSLRRAAFLAALRVAFFPAAFEGAAPLEAALLEGVFFEDVEVFLVARLEVFAAFLAEALFAVFLAAFFAVFFTDFLELLVLAVRFAILFAKAPGGSPPPPQSSKYYSVALCSGPTPP